MKKQISIFLAVFIFFVIILTPAKLVENFIPQNSKLFINGVEGSLWSGSINNLEYANWSVEDLIYELNLLPLLMGHLSAIVEINSGDIKGNFGFNFSNKENITLDDANLEVSLEPLKKYIPFPSIDINGHLLLRNFTFTLVDNKPELVTGLTSWNDASVNFNGQEWMLGHYVIKWRTDIDKRRIIGTMENPENNIVQLMGEVTLSHKGELEFIGSIAEKTDENIYNAFSLFSNGKVKEGRLPIKYKQKLF